LSEITELSAGDALKYLQHHGEKISASNLRNLSGLGVIRSTTTPGGHRRYTQAALQGYLSGFEHKTFYVSSCYHLPSLEVDTAHMTIMKTERYVPIVLKSPTIPTIIVEIYNLLKEENGSKSIFVTLSQDLIESNYLHLLCNLVGETKTTLILI
jgi:hypothetical protein